MESKRKWRWGVHRWIVLLLIILGAVGVSYYAPVQPHIQAAAEKLTEEPWFSLPVIGDFYPVNTFTSMLLTMAIIIGVAYTVKRTLAKGEMVPRGITGVMELAVEALYNMTEGTTGAKWAKKIFPWFATILLVVLVANLIKLLPGYETIGILHHSEHGYEVQQLTSGIATVVNTKAHEGEGYVLTPFFRAQATDLNFTLSLALISIFMVQVIGFQAQGPRYLEKFFNFRTLFSKPIFGFMDVIVGLLELISEFAKIISFTFRLFGNMFAGFVLMAVIGVLIPTFAPAVVMLFELFIGLIQAYVFGMLTMVFMAQATQGHGGGEEHAAVH